MLINALVPPPLPPVPDDVTPAQQYAIAGGANRSRVGQPIPLVIGKHRVALDLAANRYPSFEGGESYYYGVYNAGLCPDATITNLKIGDTLVTDYSDIETEYSDDTGALDLFPTNVDTVSVNQNLVDKSQEVIQTTSTDTTQIAVDITYTAFHTNSKGKLRYSAMDMIMEYRLTGSTGGWSALVGATNIVTLGGDNPTPVRKTYTKKVTKGQYDIRIVRLSNNTENSSNTTLNFTWNTLRSFQPDTGDYDKQRRIAIKYKATNSLNGTLSEVNALISNKCITWDGTN